MTPFCSGRGPLFDQASYTRAAMTDSRSGTAGRSVYLDHAATTPMLPEFLISVP